jgi:hypothetical protein
MFSRENLIDMVAETEPRSQERLQVILTHVFEHYTYEKDQSKYGYYEFWHSEYDNLRENGHFTGDCDTFAATLFDVLFDVGGWKVNEMGMQLSRPERVSRRKYNHALGAAKVKGFIKDYFLYFQCWNDTLLSAFTLENDPRHYQHLHCHRMLVAGNWPEGHKWAGQPKWYLGQLPE